MRRFWWFIGIVLWLGSCGAYAPPAEPLSPVERRATEVSLAAQPTLVAIPTSAPAPPPAIPPTPEPPSALADDPRSLGDPNAPVTIYEYSDFECPFCASFVRDTKPQLVATYVETGQVRIVFRDFPLPNHASAELAAVTARCAGEQGAFWPMYEQLFATHRIEWGGVPLRDRAVMVEFAANLGLALPQFETCLDDPSVAEAVREESRNASRLGINSTPNFLINGQIIRGALPFGTFEAFIERALNEATQ